MDSPTRIARPAPEEYAPYYRRYLDLVPGDDAWPELAADPAPARAAVAGLPEARALHRYAPGKWSVKELLVHVSDTERVFAYRLLRVARHDATPLAGFDENAWAPESGADARPLDAIVAELRAVRAATLALIGSLPPGALERRGVANGQPVSARACAWIIAGHERHHAGILRERYGLGG